MLEVTGLTVRYGTMVALDDISQGAARAPWPVAWWGSSLTHPRQKACRCQGRCVWQGWTQENIPYLS